MNRSRCLPSEDEVKAWPQYGQLLSLGAFGVFELVGLFGSSPLVTSLEVALFIAPAVSHDWLNGESTMTLALEPRLRFSNCSRGARRLHTIKAHSKERSRWVWGADRAEGRLHESLNIFVPLFSNFSAGVPEKLPIDNAPDCLASVAWVASAASHFLSVLRDLDCPTQ